MLINWFTVVAQIINFLVLVWLLKRYLYKPILNAVDAREKRIAAQINDAEKKQADAAQDRDEFIRKKTDLDNQRNAILQQAAQDAAAEKERLLGEARKEAAALQQALADKLSTDRQRISDEIARRTRAEVFELAKKTLQDLSGASVEDRIIDVFVKKLAALTGDGRARILEAFHTSGQVTIRTGFALQEQQRQNLVSRLNETIGKSLQYSFETLPDLVGGIELYADGYKLAWNIDEYLKSAAAAVDEVMQKNGYKTDNNGDRSEQADS